MVIDIAPKFASIWPCCITTLNWSTIMGSQVSAYGQCSCFRSLFMLLYPRLYIYLHNEIKIVPIRSFLQVHLFRIDLPKMDRMQGTSAQPMALNTARTNSREAWNTPAKYPKWEYIVDSPNVFIKQSNHDDVIKWKHFPRYWPFVRGIHRSPVNSPHKGQWRGALMFSLMSV